MRTFTVLLVYVGMLSSPNSTSTIHAEPLTFEFSGVVQEDELGSLFPGVSLFPGKSVGESYSGNFTVDPAATVTFTAPDAAIYDGSFFDIAIEGKSYNVRNFRVWSSSPPGGGVQFLFDTGTGASSVFALRSTSALYNSPDVPTSFDASSFDSLASARQDLSGSFDDKGSIDAISPAAEPGNDPSLLTFEFSGVVQRNQLKSLFHDKTIGESYSGSFTVDPSASITSTSPGLARYDGSLFDITIEGTSYNVTRFKVWDSAPTGVEFDFDTSNGSSSSFSLRSTSDLYTSAAVPMSFDVGDFDALAQAMQHFSGTPSVNEQGSVDAISPIPEPRTVALAALGLLGIGYRWRKWA